MTMSLFEEVAVTSCLNDPVACVSVWDVQSGTNLISFRGDTPVTTGGVSILASQYVVAALKDKPFLRVWPVNSQQSLSTTRLVCPGKVSHAQVSPDNCYIAVTVAEKLHIYQFGSGCLVGSGVRHFQPIKVIRWISDGSQVVCGGEDGLITIWTLVCLLAASQQPSEPRHVLADHTLPVTDITTTLSPRPRLVSVSVDHTCKIYDLYEGSLLLSVVFDKMLTAVAMSVLETDMFVGTESGPILQLSLLSPPRHLEYHLTDDDSLIFTGHSKSVCCLSTSLSGELLMSGSTDASVKIWHISSRQCLRSLDHKGPVTNAFFTLKPPEMFENDLEPSVVINSFKNINNEKTDCIEVITKQSTNVGYFSADKLQTQGNQTQDAGNLSEQVNSLKAEVDSLRMINSNLYKFTLDKVIAGNSSKVNHTEEKERRKRKRAIKNS